MNHSSIRLPVLRRAASVTLAQSLMHAAFAAQPAWPEKPIRMIVPFAAGGNTDIVGRLIGPELSNLLGQPVQIL